MKNPSLSYDPNLQAESLNVSVNFINPGHLDPRAFKVFGLSAKPDSTNPIGQFGTGLKYAIAICLRHGCSITIRLCQTHDAPQVFTFSTSGSNFRGTAIDEILCHEPHGGIHALPFTLALGKHWELWQAFRELESNCRDEGGSSGIELQSTYDQPWTEISIQGPAFLEVYHNRYSVFLHPSFYTKAHESIEAYSTEEETQAFFNKGVAVFATPNSFLFTYDIKNTIALTEDRTVSSIWTMRASIAKHWLNSDDPVAIFKVITAPEAFEENSVDYDAPVSSVSDAFKEAVAEALVKAPRTLNKSAQARCQAHTMDERFVKRFELTPIEQNRMAKATDFLRRLGYDISLYPLELVDIDSELAGMAKNGTIYLTRVAFRQSTLYLASTILEEFFHLKHGYFDHTSRFQDFLHDEILRMGEKVLGEPL